MLVSGMEGMGKGKETYEDNPAVRANGTVNPSENPIIISLTKVPYA
jgi:hypothetical protein